MIASDAIAPFVPARLARAAACMLGTALIVLFVVTAIGEGPPPELLVDPQMVSLVVMLFGFAVAWWNGLLGGMISLLGIGSFYVLNYSYYSVLPSGWVFPLCFVPGVLLVLAGLLRRTK